MQGVLLLLLLLIGEWLNRAFNTVVILGVFLYILPNPVDIYDVTFNF